MKFIDNVDLDRLDFAVKKRNYLYTADKKKDFDPFVFGIRNNDLQGTANLFDDVVGCAFYNGKELELLKMDATTKPGMYYLSQEFGNGLKPGKGGRTGILADRQYFGTFLSMYPNGQFPPKAKMIGNTPVKFLHRGKHWGLGQMGGAVWYYQDDSLDGVIQINEKTLISGYAGCNIHTTVPGYTANNVWNFSAMCQVVLNYGTFENKFMGTIIWNAWQMHQMFAFSYSLFQQKDFGL